MDAFEDSLDTRDRHGNTCSRRRSRDASSSRTSLRLRFLRADGGRRSCERERDYFEGFARMQEYIEAGLDMDEW